MNFQGGVIITLCYLMNVEQSKSFNYLLSGLSVISRQFLVKIQRNKDISVEAIYDNLAMDNLHKACKGSFL